MFYQARIKLSLYYLLIIMLISGTFSIIIYRSISFELGRLASRRVNRMEIEFGYPAPPQLTVELVEESRLRLIRVLIGVNGIILVGAGVGGYYLAGRTLKPIEEVLEEQKQFISNASHDLRTPITAMRSSLEVALRDPKLNDKLAIKYLSENLDDVIQLQNLSEGLLELSRNHDVKNFLKIDVKEVIEAACKEVLPLASAKNIILTSKLSEKANVIGDALMLQRAFVALIDNAIKYSQINSTVSIDAVSHKNMIHISVRDQGMGIKKSEINRLTDRFYRSDMARTRGGYGLGLSIAQKILKTHGGELSIKSKLNHGTTVVVTLRNVS